MGIWVFTVPFFQRFYMFNLTIKCWEEKDFTCQSSLNISVSSVTDLKKCPDPLWVGLPKTSLGDPPSKGIRTLGSSPSSASDLLGVLEQVIAPSTPHTL